MLNPYANGSRPKEYRSRDPKGYQERRSWSDERGQSMQAGVEMDRLAVATKNHRDDANTRGRDPESFATVYNSFTAAYVSKNNETGHYDHINNNHHQYGEAGRHPPSSMSRVRRVQFSKQLETDAKAPAQTPTMATIPILRSGGRTRHAITTPTLPPRHESSRTIFASPRHLVDQKGSETYHNSRDPTPRGSSSSQKLSELTKSRGKKGSKKDSNHSNQTTPDPPMNPTKDPLFSPACRDGSKNILNSLERMEKRNNHHHHNNNNNNNSSSSRKNKNAEDTRRSKPLNHGQLDKAVSKSSQSPFRSSGERLPPGDKHSKSPFQRATRAHSYQSVDSRLSSPSALRSQNDEPLRAYSPRADHWDAPDLYPGSWRQSNDDEKEADDDESQSIYLINKYTKKPNDLKNSKNSTHHDLPTKTEGTPKSTPSSRVALSDETNFMTPQYKTDREVKREVKSEPWSKHGKRTTNANGYVQLGDDDETAISFEENAGTELVLLPGLPRQIDIGSNDDEEMANCRSTSASKKRRGLGKILPRRQPAEKSSEKTSKVPFHRLPVVAISFDDDSGDLKQSTDDTDENSGSSIHQRASKWNTFDIESASEAHTKDFLLASHRLEAKKRLRLLLMLIFLVIFCLAVGLPAYFKMLEEVETDVAVDFSIETSDCAMGDITASTFSERYSTIRNYLENLEASDVDKINEANTPQRRALCWLSEFDERDVGVMKGDIPALIQRYTLAVIYFSLASNNLGEPNALIKAGFLSSDHECEWDVVVCGVPRKVTALLLSEKQLAGTLPEEISNLTNLSILELSMNELKGSIPTAISKLSMLEYFAMALNGLTGTLPTELSVLTNLESINLRSSQIHGTIPSELGRLTALETLLLERNWLSGTIPSSFGNLHSAKEMTFRNNYLSGKVPREICELRVDTLSELEVDSWIDCDCCTSS